MEAVSAPESTEGMGRDSRRQESEANYYPF